MPEPSTVRRRTALLLPIGCALLLAACAHAPHGPEATVSWYAAHADAANSDYRPVPGADDLALAWSRDFPGMINLGPTSDGKGRLFVTTSGPGCRLHALDRATGRTLWCSADLGGQAGGDIIFITNIGVLYVLDRMTGANKMEPLRLAGMTAFDPAQGLACMRGLPACPSANTPAIDHRTGRIVFTLWAPGAPAAGLRAMRIVPGEKLQVVPEWINDALPGGTAASPTLSADGRRIYLTDNVGNLHAIEAATGAVLWSLPIGYASGGSVSLSPRGLIMPAGGRGAPLLAIADEGKRGRIVWRRDELENFGIATQAAGDRAYPTVAAADGKAELLVVDTRTGDVMDREPLPGTPFFTVGTTIDTDGTVYVPTIRGEVHAYRPATR